MFTKRRRTPELMDDPNVDRDELARSLKFIRWVNRNLGGEAALIGHLKTWSKRWPRDRPVTLLDIATGSADLPLAARRWAESAGFDLRITGVDNHATTLDLAREHVRDVDGIELIKADALNLTDRFEPGSFDYVHAGLFLHHLDDIEVLTVLRMMDRLARAGIVWNDLVRSKLAAAGIRALTIRAPQIVRHDAIVSVQAGFTKGEALDVRRRVGIGYCEYKSSLLAQRFTLAGEKGEAWEGLGVGNRER